MAFDPDWNKDKGINQPDIVAAQDIRFVKSFEKFDLSNPHPGFGKDPNIINEMGHTISGFHLDDPLNVSRTENLYRAWMGFPSRNDYALLSQGQPSDPVPAGPLLHRW